LSRRTPSRARSKKSDVETDVDAVPAVVTAGPKLPIAVAEYQPPAAAAELPPFEHRPQRRVTK